MVNNGYQRQTAMDIVAGGAADLVSFGRPFIGNPTSCVACARTSAGGVRQEDAVRRRRGGYTTIRRSTGRRPLIAPPAAGPEEIAGMSASMPQLLLRNARIFDGTNAECAEGMSVLVATG